MIYSDILFAEGQNNMGGLRTIGWYGFIEDVDTFPEIPATPADIEIGRASCRVTV